ncbi:MAG: DUF4359 domain-containing protein [Cyanobacteria bacterium J06639_16]
MGFLKTSAILVGIALVGAGGVLVVTNPDRVDYEQYATDQLTAYLQTEVCADAPSILGGFTGAAELLSQQCETLIQDNRTQIESLVSNSTTQTDLWILTIYQTTLQVPGVEGLPAWEFESVGIFQRFITYKAAQV